MSNEKLEIDVLKGMLKSELVQAVINANKEIDIMQESLMDTHGDIESEKQLAKHLRGQLDLARNHRERIAESLRSRLAVVKPVEQVRETCCGKSNGNTVSSEYKCDEQRHLEYLLDVATAPPEEEKSLIDHFVESMTCGQRS